MSVFKCKMCGGTLEINPGETVGTCEYCGTKQTLPKLDDDRKVNMFDRANHFRRNNDYDKAASIYEQILNEDSTDAETYWSLVLCRYGIEYVEDPATHKRIPTVNRAQFTSIFDDADYKSALQYADIYQRSIYEEEANAINEIQKGILAISQKEEPFDVFICYKETDNNGRRTMDSVLANDLYHQLAQEGFKVFFSRITLEDKLGTAYEPYIFAALNSAKVMVVLGTKPEHFNAVWVKNEWSRYLALVKQSNGSKVLIPAYRDMDPYDLPDEFSHLQAQDMSKLGFMQDLIRGIKKISNVKKVKTTEEKDVNSDSYPGTISLLERVSLFLEDENWQEANIYCERVLDIEPKNAKAYLGKLLAELKVRSKKELIDCQEPFDDKDNYKKILRFGDEKLVSELRDYIDKINERNELNRLTGIYDEACSVMNSANTESSFLKAAELFKNIPGFKDSDLLLVQCIEKAEEQKKAAEQAEAKASEVISTFNSMNSFLGKLETSKNKIQRLEDLLDVPRQRSELRKIGDEKDVLEARAILGVFVNKVKEKTDKELLLLEKRRIEIEKSIKCCEKNAHKYTSESEIKEEILNEKNIIADLKLQIESQLDSYKKALEIYMNDSAAAIIVRRTCPNRSTMHLGHYKEREYEKPVPIEWIIVAVEDNKALLISKKALDCQTYHADQTESITWETCSLRKWLNDTFLNNAFSQKEKEVILTSEVKAEQLSDTDMDSGNDTYDKVFCLSAYENLKYLKYVNDNSCKNTYYCTTQGGANQAGCCWWWLRSRGKTRDSVTELCVSPDGRQLVNILVNDTGVCVRPAIWINIETLFS